MVVSQNKGTPINTPNHHNPYYGDPKKVPLILGNPPFNLTWFNCSYQNKALPRLDLIDTPGWCPDLNTDIHAEYKKVLREKGLPKEHAPHIILFCVSVSMLRQFQEGKAKQMSKQLQKLKFDQRFPIRVLPVATKADTESLGALEELTAVIKELAEMAFKDTGAIIDEPEWTMFDPNRQERVRGPREVSQWIKTTLLGQLRSDEFTGLWRLALAKSVKEHTREHCERQPANDSALRLFHRACSTVAAACDRGGPFSKSRGNLEIQIVVLYIVFADTSVRWMEDILYHPTYLLQ